MPIFCATCEPLSTLQTAGLCHRCHEKILWKKKYRKYKPLKKPRKCRVCELPAIKKAYHTLCSQCAKNKACCAWCQIPHGTENGAGAVVVTRQQREQDAEAEQEATLKQIAHLRERDRRTLLRRMERGEDLFVEETEGKSDDEEDSNGVGEGTFAQSSMRAQLDTGTNDGVASDADMDDA